MVVRLHKTYSGKDKHTEMLTVISYNLEKNPSINFHTRAHTHTHTHTHARTRLESPSHFLDVLPFLSHHVQTSNNCSNARWWLQGRNGLGSIYVWASGDGGPDDDCNCDGYAASMWTISINSATNDGQTAGYDESCSSTLASTFSNGKKGYQDAGVVSRLGCGGKMWRDR